MNLYGFVGNDGVNAWDSFGLAETSSDCIKRCEEEQNKFATSDVNLTWAEIEKAGKCSLYIQCKCCDESEKHKGDGGYTGVPAELEKDGRFKVVVTICCDKRKNGATYGEKFIHEIQHVFDYCKGNLDTDPEKKTCDQVVCSEIKAYKRQKTWNGKIMSEKEMKDLAARSASKKCGSKKVAGERVEFLWDKCNPEDLPGPL